MRATGWGMIRAGFLVLALLLAAPQTARAQAAADGVWRWVQALVEPFAAVTDWMTGLLAHEERLVAREIERFKAVIDGDLTALEQLIRASGYRLESVAVGAGLLPRITLSVDFVRRLPQPEKAALLARVSDGSGAVGTVERSIVMILLNAADSVYAVRGDGYRLSGIEIDVGVIPDVTFILSKAP